MSDTAQTLRDVIDRAKTKQDVTSTNALAKIARAAGFGVSHTTLAAIVKGDYPSQPGKATIDALVYLSGVGFEEVCRAAGVDPGVPYAPPEVAKHLTVKQREVVNTVIRALVEAGANKLNVHSNAESETQASVAYVTDADVDNPDGLTHSSDSG